MLHELKCKYKITTCSIALWVRAVDDILEASCNLLTLGPKISKFQKIKKKIVFLFQIIILLGQMFSFIIEYQTTLPLSDIVIF